MHRYGLISAKRAFGICLLLSSNELIERHSLHDMNDAVI